MVCTLGTILFSAYYKTTDYYSNSRWFAATYGSVEKVLCVFEIGLFIFGLVQGLGGEFILFLSDERNSCFVSGFIRKFLEWGPMHTMGKLSFGTFLIHFVFIRIDTGLQRNPVHASVYLTVLFLRSVPISFKDLCFRRLRYLKTLLYLISLQ